MDEECSTSEKIRNSYKIIVRKTVERRLFGNLGTDWETIFTLILRKNRM
jgi:hypothetical protein